MKLGALPTVTLDTATDTVLVVRDVAGVKSDIRVPATDFAVPTTPGTPTVVLGTGAGAGATHSLIEANDLRGQIQVTTGSAPIAAAAILLLAFSVAYPNPVTVVICPADSKSADLVSDVYVITGVSASFNIQVKSGITFPANTTFTWAYIVQP